MKLNYKKSLYSIKNITLVAIVGLLLLSSTAIIFAQQTDFCGTLSREFAGFFDCNSSFSTFTQFTGGLSAPDATGYDESLTQAEDLKTFANNVANFVLGFLGLIAVLIIIYSGFLYVTSRGDNEQMESGKKGITYALIGIIIIFSSYALVNTILQAPGGDGSNIRQQSTVGNRSVGSSNFNSSAREIQTITADFLREYQRTETLYRQLVQLKNYTPTDFTSRNDFITYLEFLRTSLRNTTLNTTELSYLRRGINAIIEESVNPRINEIQNRVIREEEQLLKDQARSQFSEISLSIGRGVSNIRQIGSDSASSAAFWCSQPPSERPANFDFRRCSGDATEEKTSAATNANNEIDTAIEEFLIPLLARDLQESMLTNSRKLKAQRDIFSEQNPAYEPLNGAITNINTTFKLTQEGNNFVIGSLDLDLDSLFTTPTATSSPDNNMLLAIRSIIENLERAHNAIKDLEFMVPNVLASTRQGSAPLVVTFDASESLDPSGRSIATGQFSWDINGDGQEGSGSLVDCFGVEDERYKRSTMNCVFREPGQYTTRLTINPPANTSILPGIAYIPISVTAPTTQIKLRANVGDEATSTVLRQYDERGNLQIDVNQFAVTLEQARLGITFDASETETDDKRISQYAWTFSDSGLEVIGTGTESGTVEISGTGNVVGQNARTVKREFNQRGSYNVQLAVTDVDGNIDRKLLTIRITDLVARISSRNNLTSGIPGTEFVFDASGSRSDVTPNLKYIWEVEDDPNNNGEDTHEAEEGEVEFRKRFTTPGTKTIKLTVSDGRSSREETATFTVNIDSQNPTASMDTVFPDRTNQPNLVMFDGTGSFDPDNPIESPNAGLKYGWRIFNATEGVDYDLVTGTIGSTSSAQGIVVPTTENNGNLEVAFKRTGNFRVELTVEDRFGMRNVTTRDINITSIVDVKFADSQEYAVQIETDDEGNARANVSFSLESRNAETAQINFGDNSQPQTVRFENGEANFSHIYSRAGSFEVTVRAQRGNDVNNARTLIIVGGSDSPIAIPRIRVGTTTVNNLSDLPPIYRGTQLSFDAESSVNTDGTNSGLRYEWSMGDGRSFTTAQIPAFSYSDLPPADPGHFIVTLTVINTTNPSLRDSRTIEIPVVGAKPTLQALLARPQVGREQTPINVNVEAIGATDRDGRIVNYRFYYFPISDPSRQRGVKNVSIPSTTITVNTWGEQGQEVDYAFCVDLTDNEGNEVKCDELFPSANYTQLNIRNGRNDPPRSEFVVDRTNINVGETVNFRSTSVDPDGDILEWTYDFYGDGSFANDRVWEQGNVSHTYTRKSDRDGFAVRLRVLDDKGATAVSQPVRIFVDGRLEPPTAAFTEVSNDRTVQFRDRSTADSENGGEIVEYKWNFDTVLNPTGVDSTERNPTHTYPRSGVYNVSLTVVDNEGNENTLRRQVIVQAIEAGKPNPFANATVSGSVDENDSSEPVNTDGQPMTPQQVVQYQSYQNLIRSNPARNQDTGRITMSPSNPTIQLRFDHLPRDTKRIFIDQNIYFDSDGDGVRNNDIDIERFDLGPLSIQYPASQQNRPIRILVAVEAADGQIYMDQADIVFPGLNFQASLNFRLTDNIPALTYLVFLILVLIIGPYFITKKDSKHKKKLKI